MQRRNFMFGAGFGAVGLAGTAAGATTHHAPKAKHVIFLFLNGGLSQVDTFDPKPELTRMHNTPLPGPKVKTDSATGNLMKSPYSFRKYGQSGIEVAEIGQSKRRLRQSFRPNCAVDSTSSSVRLSY